MLSRKLILLLLLLAGAFCCKNANAQLSSYIGWTPAKEKAFEKRLKKEAYKVITHYDADKFPYDEMIYRMQSLDSTICYLHLMYIPFSREYSIKCETDSLKINDFRGEARLHFLRKDLFEIVYSPRGGSDDGYENVLLLAVKNGKFRIAMEIQTMHDYDGPGFVGLNETHLTLIGKAPQNYQLTLKNQDMRDDDKKSKSFNHHHSYTLKYDNTLNVFYTSHEMVKGYVYNDDPKKERQLSGVFPVIKLGDDKYCYITDSWYSEGSDFDSKKTILVNYTNRPPR